MGGGIEAILAINFVMTLAVLVGLEQLVAGTRAGQVFSLVLAAFNVPASKVVLGATLMVSPVQAWQARRGLLGAHAHR